MNNRAKEKFVKAKTQTESPCHFRKKLPIPQRPTAPISKILPFLCKKTDPQNKPSFIANEDDHIPLPPCRPLSQPPSPEVWIIYIPTFPDVGGRSLPPCKTMKGTLSRDYSSSPNKKFGASFLCNTTSITFTSNSAPICESIPACLCQAGSSHALPVHIGSPTPATVSAPPNKTLVEAEVTVKNSTGVAL
ncbi:unnamed protein product [Fraxinus pennsylvanica]|uniref:Uncharacterized protein n=1 Tax=Fraxinus pennsylvanica TaxID=56036 RepID=A0AAD1ZVE2_9LAMI|nr:unnamed protein product [Fraxinus pennsylvanica]